MFALKLFKKNKFVLRFSTTISDPTCEIIPGILLLLFFWHSNFLVVNKISTKCHRRQILPLSYLKLNNFIFNSLQYYPKKFETKEIGSLVICVKIPFLIDYKSSLIIFLFVLWLSNEYRTSVLISRSWLQIYTN